VQSSPSRFEKQGPLRTPAGASSLATTASEPYSRRDPLRENIAFREELSSDAVVLHDFALLLSIPLRDGCDLLDVIGRRLQAQAMTATAVT